MFAVMGVREAVPMHATSAAAGWMDYWRHRHQQLASHFWCCQGSCRRTSSRDADPSSSTPTACGFPVLPGAAPREHNSNSESSWRECLQGSCRQLVHLGAARLEQSCCCWGFLTMLVARHGGERLAAPLHATGAPSCPDSYSNKTSF